MASGLCRWAVALLVAGVAARGQAGGNQGIGSFARAKRELSSIYRDHAVTLYSGCGYDTRGLIVAQACSFVPRRPDGRGGRIEWEHVVPAAALGSSLPSWRLGDPRCVDGRGRRYRGRRCASKVSAQFRRLEADLYNLVPEIGEVNNMRGNLPMGEVGPRFTIVAGLDSRMDGGRFEPGAAVKGDVARIHLYMDAAYPELGLLSDPQRAMLRQWSALDPTDAWECLRALRIARVQGNINSFVTATCDG